MLLQILTELCICVVARTIPPRRLRRSAVQRLIADRLAEAIAENERNRPNPANTRGVVAPNVHGCTYKTFMNGKPHPFNGTYGVVGLRCWFEKSGACDKRDVGNKKSIGHFQVVIVLAR
ncbi:hypothetical protein Tco_0160894, partial [Tanacetum coccineum]